MRYLITTIAMLALACGSVFAQEDMAESTPSFSELDADGNGYVSQREAAVLPCLSRNFSNVDKQSDEGLSQSEYSKAVDEHCRNSGY